MPNERILIVEDQAEIRELLRSFLTNQGFVVHEARNGAEMRARLAESPIQLITLDLNLAGEDGLALARMARTICDIPIIIISARSEDIDRIIGLEVGADDYIVKPFNLREVVARVRAVLRRCGTRLPAGPAILQFGDWMLNLSSHQLGKADGTAAALTAAELNLLVALLRGAGRVQTRDSLLEATRGRGADQLDRSIDTLVGRLRKKIEPDPEQPRYIKTIRGAGYIFAAEVIRR